MGSLSTATFCKHTTCPSAETLLLYQSSILTPELRHEVAKHLSVCDFCGAEMFLLSKYPPVGVPLCRHHKMPLPLYQLAQDLLLPPARFASTTIELIYEKDRLTLTDA